MNIETIEELEKISNAHSEYVLVFRFELVEGGGNENKSQTEKK